MSTSKDQFFRVQRLLTEAGWESSTGAAIATKTYATAVGPKQAVVYFLPPNQSRFYGVITAEYWSEGRNILSTVHQALLPAMSDDELKEKVLMTLADVDQTVSQSYAARLLATS